MLTPKQAEEVLGRRGGRWVRSPARFLGYFQFALKLLTERGWCQGAYARSRRGYTLHSGKDKHAAAFCAIGAIERAAPEHKDFKVCNTILRLALGVQPTHGESISLINDDRLDVDGAKAKIFGAYGESIAALKALCDK
jgi:hypothetical protein